MENIIQHLRCCMSSINRAISNTPKSAPYFRPVQKEDLVKCLGENESFQAKSYNKLKTLFSTGEFVRDATVEKFLQEELKNHKTKDVFEGVFLHFESGSPNSMSEKEVKYEKAVDLPLEKIFYKALVKLRDETGRTDVNDLAIEKGLITGKMPLSNANAAQLQRIPTETLHQLDFANLPKDRLEALFVEDKALFEKLSGKQLWNLQYVGYRENFSKELMTHLSKALDKHDQIRLRPGDYDVDFYEGLSPSQMDKMPDLFTPEKMRELTAKHLSLMSPTALQHLNVKHLSNQCLKDLAKSNGFSKFSDEQINTLLSKKFLPPLAKLNLESMRGGKESPDAPLTSSSLINMEPKYLRGLRDKILYAKPQELEAFLRVDKGLDRLSEDQVSVLLEKMPPLSQDILTALEERKEYFILKKLYDY